MIEQIKNSAYKLLRRSERYAKTDMVYVARSGFWLTSARIVTTASSFLIAIAFANLLPMEVYGNYKYILSIIGLLAASTLSGIDSAIITSVAKKMDGTIVPAFQTKLRWSFGGMLIGICVAAYYLWHGNQTLGFGCLIGAMALPPFESMVLYASILQGKRQFKRLHQITTISRICTAVTIISAVYFSRNIIVVLFAYQLQALVVRWYFWQKTKKAADLTGPVDPNAITYGKKYSLLKIITGGIENLFGIAIFQLLGSQALATYTFALAPIEHIRSVVKIADQIILPKISQTSWVVPHRFFLIKKILPFIFSLIAISMVYIALAPFLFNFIFPQYHDAILISQISALTLIPSGIALIGNSILRAKQKIRSSYSLAFLQAITMLGIVLPGLYFFGMLGLVWGMVIAKSIQAMILMIMVSRPSLYINNEISLDLQNDTSIEASKD